jgi:osmotically-inducible protein OsmY
MASFLWGSVVGAAAAYFLDPRLGRTRRKKLQDMAAGRVRRLSDEAERRANKLRSDVRGKAEAIKHLTPEDREPDDGTVAQRVRSDALRGHHPEILVDVAEGRVTLRGGLADGILRREIVARVMAVPGVHAVEDLLHEPGTPAPNKAPAMRATDEER